jgi:hypothetical protein
VTLSWPSGSTRPLAVSPAGIVRLPRLVSARSFRLEILRAAAPAGASPADRRAVGIAELAGAAGLPPVTAPSVAAFAAGCGSVTITVGGRLIRLAVGGSRAAFEDGTPLLARSCGAAVPLSAGLQLLTVAPGPFAVDNLALSSPAPEPLATVAGGGTVVSPGTAGHGSYDNVRVDVSGPSWLVLGDSYDRGWRAWCNGRSLGSPVPIDGYANGWPVGAGCRDVRFSFKPNKLAAVGYLVSAIGALVCVILVAAPWWRRRRKPAPPRIEEAEIEPTSITRLAPLRAIVVAVALGIPFGFVFGIEAGIVSVPVIAVCLALGVGARALTLTAGALLGIVVPILYLANPGDERGGNHFSYSVMHMAAHWVGVAALGLLIGALWRSLPRERAHRSKSATAARPPAAVP